MAYRQGCAQIKGHFHTLWRDREGFFGFARQSHRQAAHQPDNGRRGAFLELPHRQETSPANAYLGHQDHRRGFEPCPAARHHHHEPGGSGGTAQRQKHGARHVHPGGNQDAGGHGGRGMEDADFARLLHRSAAFRLLPDGMGGRGLGRGYAHLHAIQNRRKSHHADSHGLAGAFEQAGGDRQAGSVPDAAHGQSQIRRTEGTFRNLQTHHAGRGLGRGQGEESGRAPVVPPHVSRLAALV